MRDPLYRQLLETNSDCLDRSRDLLGEVRVRIRLSRMLVLLSKERLSGRNVPLPDSPTAGSPRTRGSVARH